MKAVEVNSIISSSSSINLCSCYNAILTETYLNCYNLNSAGAPRVFLPALFSRVLEQR